jgi:hypothetical protein
MYYPKSQIKINLYTNGGEFTNNNTKQDYQGYYFKTSSGQFFTGKTPQNPPNIPLTPVRKTAEERLIKLDNYQNLPADADLRIGAGNSENPRKSNLSIPQNSIVIESDSSYTYPPIANAPVTAVVFPTNNDYTIGEFQRYFLKKRNEIQYLEVNLETYQNYVNQVNGVQWQLYLPITIPWELTGDYDSVYNTNRNIVLLKESTLKVIGFAQYFRNQFTKYFRFEPGENLYTAGNELKNSRTNMNYIGYYHLSSTGKAIAGKRATADMQDILIPITENLEVGTSRRKNVAYNPDSLKKDNKRFGY